MATRNIVPRATGEGSIGTPEKKWNSASIKNINAESLDIDNLDIDNLDVENLDVENLDVENLDVENLDVHSESVSPVNTLQRGTTYAADDIVYTSKLNAKYYLLCITGGTTGSVEPSFTGAGSNTEVTDGTVVWRVQMITSQEKAETYTDTQVSAAVPTGCVQAFAGNTTPQGWLLCDGSAVSRTDYAELYSVIGDTYGAGDGASTFNLPNLIDKFVQGNAVAGTEHSAGLPNITGQYSLDEVCISALNNNAIMQGAFTLKPTLARGTETVGNRVAGGNKDIAFDASLSNSIYGNSTTVQPPSVTMRYIIKY